MHINHLLDEFNRLENIEWVACADTVPDLPSTSMKNSARGANLRRAHEVVGIPKVYDDYRALLEKEAVDAVIFCPENAKHPEVAEAIAAAGAHLLTEKPMAADLPGALRIARAVRSAGVSLMVNWPITWSPAVRKAKELIDAGRIGEVGGQGRNGASMGPLSYGTGDQAFSDDEKAPEWWHHAAPRRGSSRLLLLWGLPLALVLGEGATAAYGLKANLNSHYGAPRTTPSSPCASARPGHPRGHLDDLNVGVPTGPIVYGTRGPWW